MLLQINSKPLYFVSLHLLGLCFALLSPVMVRHSCVKWGCNLCVRVAPPILVSKHFRPLCAGPGPGGKWVHSQGRVDKALLAPGCHRTRRNNHITFKFVVSWTPLLGICNLFCLILEHICGLKWAKSSLNARFHLTSQTAPQSLLLYSRQQWFNGCRVIPASSAEPGPKEKCRLWIHCRDTELWPLSPLNFPLEVFFLIAEKRAGLCFKKKRKKKRRGFF